MVSGTPYPAAAIPCGFPTTVPATASRASSPAAISVRDKVSDGPLRRVYRISDNGKPSSPRESLQVSTGSGSVRDESANPSYGRPRFLGQWAHKDRTANGVALTHTHPNTLRSTTWVEIEHEDRHVTVEAHGTVFGQPVYSETRLTCIPAGDAGTIDSAISDSLDMLVVQYPLLRYLRASANTVDV